MFQGLEKFRTKFQRLEEKVPKLGNWPRQGGIAERCNAEGRNRRRRNPAAKHTAPPAREPYPATTQQRRNFSEGGGWGKSAEIRGQVSEVRRLKNHGRCRGRFAAEERVFGGNGGAGPRENPWPVFRARVFVGLGSGVSAPTPHLIGKTRGWRGFCRDEGASTKP